MPIRFACPQCQQRLSVSTRKAGTLADCPRCRRAITIPQALPQDSELSPQTDAAQHSPAATGELAESYLVMEPIGGPPIAAPPVVVPRLSPERSEDSGELTIVVDAALEPRQPTPPPRAADSITVPRYLIYVHGAVLAAVAFTSLLLGILFGSTLTPRNPSATAPRACRVSGSVTYSAGTRTRPDRGAVIVLIPVLAEAAGERAPVEGLRPSDPPPAADHAGLGVLQQLGGSYTRADANGRFAATLPTTGRYWLLVVSHEQRARTAADTKEIRTLSRYLQNAAELIEDRSYQLTQEAIRGDKEINVEFGG